jgi:hypothetical protein
MKFEVQVGKLPPVDFSKKKKNPNPFPAYFFLLDFFLPSSESNAVQQSRSCEVIAGLPKGHELHIALLRAL